MGYAAEVINAHLLGVEDPPVTVTSSDPGTLLVAGDSLLGIQPGTVWLIGTYDALRDSVAITVQSTQIQGRCSWHCRLEPKYPAKLLRLRGMSVLIA